jgi:hypothetical protein
MRSSTSSARAASAASGRLLPGRSDHAFRRNQLIAVVVITLRVYASTLAGSRRRGQAT